MVKSDLATIVVPADSSNYNIGRKGNKICKITPHHMSGVLSAQRCGEIFQNPNRNASSNYGIGNDGEIACYVGEENRAWTSSSPTNDYKAITIEVSNCENGGQWKVSDKAWDSLVNLCVDICKRYDFKLEYDGTPNGSLTRHNMFANTDCPGPYLQSRLQELADTVNAKLENKEFIQQTQQITSTETKNTNTGIVTIIQSTLNARYGLNIAVDNIFGKETKKALVKALQTELNRQFNKGLVVDGIFGNLTRNACVNVKQGAKGNITWILQAILICKNYSLGLDGIFGAETDRVVKQYQNEHGLVVDGIAGKNTWSVLLKNV